MDAYTYIGPGNANGNLASGVYYLTARTDAYVNANGVTDVDPTAYGNVYTPPDRYGYTAPDSNAGADAPDCPGHDANATSNG